MGPFEIAGIIVGGLLALAGAITTMGGAIEKIVKAVKAAKAPNEETAERVTVLEEWRKTVDRKLEADKSHLENIDDSNVATQRALLALLDHGIDGNNIEQMQHAKEGLLDQLLRNQ